MSESHNNSRNKKRRRGRKPVVITDEPYSQDKPKTESSHSNFHPNRSMPPPNTHETKREFTQSFVQQRPQVIVLSDRTTEQIIHLTEQLCKGEYECMVCFDRLGKRAVIWNCTNCFAIFHIGCIKKWSNASSEGDSWACPG